MPSPGEITALLRSWRSGDSEALDILMPLVYEDLRRIAISHMRSERSGHTLTPTALVHESFLKLVQNDATDFQDRKHFFVVAAKAMRQLLVDHARRKQARKRQPDAAADPIDDIVQASASPWDVIDLDKALDHLSEQDPRKAQAVELRFFGGLKLDEISELMGVSVPTVSRELRLAEAWLAQQIRSGTSSASLP